MQVASNSFRNRQDPRAYNTYTFTLKKKDINIITFTLGLSILDEIVIHLRWITDDQTVPMPYGFPRDPKGHTVMDWLLGRFIPKNRAFVENLLGAISRSSGEHFIDLIKTTLALSLTDDYWVVPDGMSLLWERHNLYSNNFSETLALVAFTGHGDPVRGIVSSPEYTTDGALRKCWRRIEDTVYLYKGGSIGAANAGLEPYSEFYATQVAAAMELNHVSYDIVKWKGVLCSTCKLFTDAEHSLVNAYGYYGNKPPSVILLEESPWRQDLLNMLAFDTIIVNSDRHFGNFGFIRRNSDGKLLETAPLYDHGVSLLNYAMKDDLDNLENYLEQRPMTFAKMSATRLSVVRSVLNRETRAKVRKLLTFEFTPHPMYNLDEKRLNLLSSLVRTRAVSLLEN